MNAHTSIVTRASIDEIIAHRREAVDLFAQAHEIIRQALKAASRAAGGALLNLDSETKSLAFSLSCSDKFLDDVRRTVDRNVWEHLVMGYGFEKIMDRQAMEEFNSQLANDPPELTAEVAETTLLQLMIDADKLFRRGIANAFARLDRRFRSHDGFKIGTRIVLEYAFSESGSWNYHKNHQDTLRDIERTFFQLDGRELPERYAGIVGAVDDLRSETHGRIAMEADSNYFRFRSFKNGNVHLWFKRDDLLKKVNKLLAEHYGEVLGAGADTFEEDPFDVFRNPRTDLARNMGWFPTPAPVVSDIIDRAEIIYAPGYHPSGQATIRVLEPSAGEGAIALATVEAMKQCSVLPLITCIELDPGRADHLRTVGFVRENGHETLETDFLSCRPDTLGLFDFILMNPPFDHQRDIDHVYHATKFLAPGGRIVAVMSAGVEFRENRKAVAFRDLVQKMDGKIYDLPAGAFESSGTMVNTCLVVMNAPRN